MKNKSVGLITPPIWARSGHLQTIWGHLLKSKMLESKGEEHLVSLNDGEFLKVFLQQGTVPVVTYLFHGLGGSTDSGYMHRIARFSKNMGHTVVMVNHRGCGEGAGYALKPYHSGSGDDMSYVFGYGKKLFPEAKHIGIGFSLSANAILLNACGDAGDIKPDYVLAINPPINLDQCSKKLSQGLNNIYDKRFILDFRRDLKHKVEKDSRYQRYIPRVTQSVYDFDQIYTAPEAGFGTRENYYRVCSTYDKLHKIQTPTHILMSEDDPFILIDQFRSAKYSSSIELTIVKHGGHLGYLNASPIKNFGHRWMDSFISQKVSEVFSGAR